MTRYVTRKIRKHVGKVIIPPTPEEILDDHFNYPDYIEHILNLKVDRDLLEEFFDSNEADFTPIDPRVTGAFEEFENAIIVLQKQYEEEIKDRRLSQDYNQAMKKIAQAYFDKLQSITIFKLQKEQKSDAFFIKMSELASILNQVVDIKRNIENGAENRLTAFVNREIPLGKLYIYDLTKIQNNEVYLKHKKALDRYRRNVFSKLLDDEGVQYKPIEQLHFQRKKQ